MTDVLASVPTWRLRRHVRLSTAKASSRSSPGMGHLPLFSPNNETRGCTSRLDVVEYGQVSQRRLKTTFHFITFIKVLYLKRRVTQRKNFKYE